MRTRPRPFDIVHVSSAHPWTDNRIHRRAAATAAAAGYRTALVAVSSGAAVPSDGAASPDGVVPGRAVDRDWGRPDPETGVWVRRIPSRPRRRRVVVSSAQAIGAALSSGARVVHLHDPELVWAVPLLRLAARVVVYDAHEDLPDQVRGKQYLGPVGRRVAVALSHLVVGVAARAHAVVAATPTIAERFPRGRTRIVRNLPVVRQADLDAPPAADRSANAVYLGSLSRDRGVDAIADVAESSALPSGWRVVTAGPVDAAVDRGRLDALHRAGLVDHRGVLDPTDARDLLLDARIGLLPLLPTPAYAASIPTKLFEYMAAGLAVIATDVPLWRELLGGAVGSAECATWVPPGDAGAVVRAIRRYADDPALLAAHAEAGRALVSARYRWQDDASTLLRLYESVWSATPFGTRNGM